MMYSKCKFVYFVMITVLSTSIIQNAYSPDKNAASTSTSNKNKRIVTENSELDASNY